MSNQATTSDILLFLAQAKRLILAWDYVFVPRRKNLQALSDHGLTVEDAKEEMLGLMIGDYFKGPKQDFDRSQSGAIWEFKKTVDGEKFYVKLKIQNLNGKDILKCLSFHEDDYS